MQKCLLGILVVLLVVACSSDAHTYSAHDVEAAFRDAGVPVAVATDATAPGKRFSGVLLRADLGSEFFVIVYDEEQDAKAAYGTMRSQATGQSFDRITRNVLVSGDELTTAERRHVAQALDQLRD